MCGFIFAAATKPVTEFVHSAHIRQLHRGPDGEGFHFEKVNKTYLGMAHQRLAIVDLSDNGYQPMVSSSGRLRILYNGEIYNHKQLAQDYKLQNLKSTCDTEVVVELIERLGIDRACSLFNGMWSFVLQDQKTMRIYISRDRFGKKPLYFYQSKNGIYVASEMHTLVGALDREYTINSLVASRFLSQSLQNIDNYSWIKEINSFSPANIAEIDLNNLPKGIHSNRVYWRPSLNKIIDERSDAEMFEELNWLVKDAVQIRLNSDVPTGIALSGGLDSSIIASCTAKLKTESSLATHLLSVVNPGSPEDESEHIQTMEDHLAIPVKRFQLNPQKDEEILDLLRKCSRHNDGPLSSFSSILFFKLMEKANDEGIKVILTGQGADEAFCGYKKYPLLEIKRKLQNGNFLSSIAFAFQFLINGTLIPEFNFKEAKRYMGHSNQSILGETAKNTLSLEPLGRVNELNERQWEDIKKYSVPHLCHYEDRMSMAKSCEVRAPFLDYRIVDFGLRLQNKLKLANGWTKYSLRKSFESEMPQEIIYRKDKKGFANPQDNWLKTKLKNQVFDIMSEKNALVYEHGFVDRTVFLKTFNDYCDNDKSVWFREVFSPFALELWLREFALFSKNAKNELSKKTHTTV